MVLGGYCLGRSWGKLRPSAGFSPNSPAQVRCVGCVLCVSNISCKFFSSPLFKCAYIFYTLCTVFVGLQPPAQWHECVYRPYKDCCCPGWKHGETGAAYWPLWSTNLTLASSNARTWTESVFGPRSSLAPCPSTGPKTSTKCLYFHLREVSSGYDFQKGYIFSPHPHPTMGVSEIVLNSDIHGGNISFGANNGATVFLIIF